MQCVGECDTDHPRVFEQPVWQTGSSPCSILWIGLTRNEATMFLGEMLCLLAFRLLLSPLNPFRATPAIEESKGKYAPVNALDSGIDIEESYLPQQQQGLTAPSRVTGHLEATTGNAADSPALNVDTLVPCSDQVLQGWKQLLFALPAFFDICGTTLMNVGLLFTPVSIYQMTRSALVLFVGFFSVVYLNRKLSKSQFAALGLVTLGVFIVGLSGMFKPEAAAEGQEEVEASKVLLGICLILFAQVL